MARLPRLTIPDQAYHVIQRGNNRQAIFFESEDYEFFLELLHEHASVFACRIHSYVLMTNHIHLLLTPASKDGLSKLMQFAGRRYVRYINKKYERTGTLWEGRFKSSLIQAENYLITCMRYIELNPVRARMVRKPEKYPWSSYHHNARDVTSKFITPHTLYKSLGTSDTKRRKAYLDLFEHAVSQDDLDVFRKTIKGGWVAGNDRFKRRIASASDRPVSPKERGGDRRSDEFKQRVALKP